MPMSDKTYTISKISQICNVSPRQLRHYEKMGLIVPYIRGDASGYRYYAKHQVAKILMIKELQKLNFSLTEIGALLTDTCSHNLYSIIATKVQQAKENLEKSYKKYAHIQSLYMEITATMHAQKTIIVQEQQHAVASQTFIVYECPRQRHISLRYFGKRADHDINMLRRAEVSTLVEKYHAKTCGPYFTIFHDHEMRAYSELDRDLEVGVPISSADFNCPAIGEHGGFKAVSTVHTGSYNNTEISQTYNALKNWANEQGFILSGKSIEEYLIDPTLTQCEAKYVTRVSLLLDDFSL